MPPRRLRRSHLPPFGGLLNGVPAAAGHDVAPPAVQCESQAPPDLVEEDGPARPGVDVKELGMRNHKPGDDEASNAVDHLWHYHRRTGDEAPDPGGRCYVRVRTQLS